MLQKLVAPLLLLVSRSSSVTAQDSQSSSSISSWPACSARTQHLSDPPYQDYFYSDCHVDAQAVVTSPLPGSDLSIIKPRFLVAWPAGNSGVCTLFQPQSGKAGSLAIELVNSTLGAPLGPVYSKSKCKGSANPIVGVEGVLSFNDSAELPTAILGSVRNIRDFTEGGYLSPIIQAGINVTKFQKTGAQISRLWLDNVTTTTFTLEPWKNNHNYIQIDNTTLRFGAGLYRFSASFNYPQLTQLTPSQLLNEQSQSLAKQRPETVSSLSFFSYTEKLLAGGWRFLTYFGRDSMISALLLQPVLSSSAVEVVIGAALERINRRDGSVSHEETIGDYATYVNLQNGIASTAAGFTYQMIDTDYYLPILMARYFNSSPNRITPLLDTKAGSIDVDNLNLTWGDLSYATASKIMNITAAFEQNQTVGNLLTLKPGQNAGQWRDSPYGLANGRIPFDVNCALAPAALNAISSLAAMPGVYPNNSMTQNWATIAAQRAKVWEDKTLQFFKYNVTAETAVTRLTQYTSKNNFYHGPTNGDSVSNYSTDGTIIDYGLAINSPTTPEIIPITHTDTAFRHYLLNATDDEQLTTFINASANAILRPFPAGLSTPIGVVVANPALSNNNDFIGGFTNTAYHGTVVWSWQLALMAKGFERQLERCHGSSNVTDIPSSITNATAIPQFCSNEGVYTALKTAYNKLWDIIEDNSQQLESEVWSWTYSGGANGTEKDFKFSPLGASGGTESDVRQLWSLTFLSVTRNKSFS